jgi:hypothetical protein
MRGKTVEGEVEREGGRNMEREWREETSYSYVREFGATTVLYE